MKTKKTQKKKGSENLKTPLGMILMTIHSAYTCCRPTFQSATEISLSLSILRDHPTERIAGPDPKFPGIRIHMFAEKHMSGTNYPRSMTLPLQRVPVNICTTGEYYYTYIYCAQTVQTVFSIFFLPMLKLEP